MNEAYIPAIITASVALIAATGAQILAHILSNKRSKNEKKDKVYQEFIYPFLPYVLLYYNTETNFRKGHDVEKEVDIERLLDRISEKVSYGNMKLLSCYYNIIKFDHFFDGRGYSKEINILRFMFWYLDYAISILSKKKPIEQELILEVKKVQRLYGIWILIAQEIDFPLAIEIMKYDFYLNEKFLSELDIELLRNLVDYDSPLHDCRANLLKIIIQELKSKIDYEIDALEELETHLSLNYEQKCSTSQLEDTK
ncbi:hypothetical protein [Parageobacillus thermoglucosidasius]|uniref:hypothetical protein n=1 Tax=Parageobacillus thermoglucosidasius TaxID=1426 RepID=UPI00025B81C6|nr:hypothetical protein [Parageobacillus thermoglucosidasius]EID42874.1 putative phage protein [Parageobacillus thermoglucosidasius TNO-09.020]KYD17872.1 hypothetical protein B4168_2433 [Anoxybacillus flavithermus]OAO85347.1 hypothetical protein GT23_3038 [Parageobacillus thermoglucosidasius]